MWNLVMKIKMQCSRKTMYQNASSGWITRSPGLVFTMTMHVKNDVARQQEGHGQRSPRSGQLTLPGLLVFVFRTGCLVYRLRCQLENLGQLLPTTIIGFRFIAWKFQSTAVIYGFDVHEKDETLPG